MRPLLLALLVLSSLCVGCGRESTLPDGGRPRINCTEDFDFVPVIVRDASGAVVADAQVTATNPSSGAAPNTGPTNAQGISTVVNEDLGSGTIEVRATAGTKQSNLGVVELVCGECSCTGEPDELTLTLPN